MWLARSIPVARNPTTTTKTASSPRLVNHAFDRGGDAPAAPLPGLSVPFMAHSLRELLGVHCDRSGRCPIQALIQRQATEGQSRARQVEIAGAVPLGGLTARA